MWLAPFMLAVLSKESLGVKLVQVEPGEMVDFAPTFSS